MNLYLTDKVALVGASSGGLGLAAALALAKEGAKVAICGRNKARLEQALQQLRQVTEESKLLAVETDLTDKTQVEHFVEQTAKQFGGIDIVITNAGGPPAGMFTTTKLEDYETAFRLTLMSAVYLIYAALPYLQQSQTASILTVTSITTKQPIAGLTLSNIFRPAVIGLTKTLSQELGAAIRVNSILPGFTLTERSLELLNTWAKQRGTSQEEEKQKRAAAVPLGRMGNAEEFGRTAAFLVSPAASYLNGVMLPFDGGAYSGLL